MKKIAFLSAALFAASAVMAAAPSPRVAVAGHTHLCRNGKVSFDLALSNLVAWVEKYDVRAFGVGSPWTPKQASRTRRCEREDRDRYFAGKIEEDLVDKADLYAMLAVLSNACPRTTFYLDNETPKNRYGHLWYIGFEVLVPGWHDYSQDKRVAFTTDEAEAAGPDLNKETGCRHLRRSYAEVVAEQRRYGGLAVWAHPTSWWTHEGKFVTNIAADMPVQLFADGGLDAITVMGYDAYHSAYQDLWFAILDMGYRVPGVAEQDCSPGHGIVGKKDESLFTYVHGLDHAPSAAEIRDAVRSFSVTMSSGPDLRILSFDDSGDDLKFRIYAAPKSGEKMLSRIEVLGRGGKVRAVVADAFEGERTISVPREAGDTWFVVRAFGEFPEGWTGENLQRTARSFAMTNPVWLKTAPKPPAPVRTRLAITDKSGTNARWRIESALGEAVCEGAGARVLEVSPTDVLCIEYPTGRKRRLPLYMANAKVRALMDYLADGGFWIDSKKSLSPGEVPVAAFRFPEFREALREQQVDL